MYIYRTVLCDWKKKKRKQPQRMWDSFLRSPAPSRDEGARNPSRMPSSCNSGGGVVKWYARIISGVLFLHCSRVRIKFFLADSS